MAALAPIGMALLPAFAGAAASAVVGAVTGPKAPPPTPQRQALPVAQRRSTTAVLDAVSSRRGSRVNQRTGARGAEPTSSAGGKTQLGA